MRIRYIITHKCCKIKWIKIQKNTNFNNNNSEA